MGGGGGGGGGKKKRERERERERERDGGVMCCLKTKKSTWHMTQGYLAWQQKGMAANLTKPGTEGIEKATVHIIYVQIDKKRIHLAPNHSLNSLEVVVK